MTNAVSAAPRMEASTGELSAGIGDKVIGRYADLGDDSAEELPDLLRCRLLFEDGGAQRFAGIVIDDDRDPPAEGPAQWEREGPPRDPEARGDRYDSQVDVPNVVRPIGGDSSRRGHMLGRRRRRQGPRRVPAAAA